MKNLILFFKIQDPRILQILNNVSIILFGILFLDYQRTLYQFFYCIMLAFIFEYTLQGFKNRNRINIYGKSFIWNRLVSATSTAVGCFIALNIPDIKFYLFPILMSFLSKAFIQRPGERGHIYNPSNFGIVLGLILLPDSKVFFYPDQFIASPYPLIQTIILGFIVNLMVNRHWQVASYLLFASLFSYLLSDPNTINFWHLFGPDLNAGSMIYLMFMISDPKTSPNRIPMQILYSFCIALITIWLRYYGSIAHQIIALFVTSSLFFLFEQFTTFSRQATTTWRTRLRLTQGLAP